MFQIILQLLFNMWPLITIISSIAGIVSLLFYGNKIKELVIKKPYKQIIIAILVLLSLSGLVSYICVSIPDVTNITYNEAQSLVRSIGISGDLATGYKYKYDELIKNQNIPTGTIVLKNDPYLNFRWGYSDSLLFETDFEYTETDLILVPSVVGKEQNLAAKELTDAGLKFQVWWTEDNNAISDHYYIISQSIPADSYVSPGTIVKIELSPYMP